MLCGDIPDQQKSKNVAASETETASENVESSRKTQLSLHPPISLPPTSKDVSVASP